ncbi:MAG TPA: hypothetical protein VIU61_09715 [Kofleriaceae bacterium]
MRSSTRLATRLACLILALAACGHGHDDNDYPTLQACFDEHVDVEMLSIEQAIVVCTLDHTFGGTGVDFATSAECETFVAANLEDADATTAQITAACADYIIQKDQ